MNANNDAHIARLEDLLAWSAKDGDRPALRAAIRALSADRGEAVPVAWADPASMQGYTLGASSGFAAGDKSGSRNAPLYLHPPSPAESAEGVLTHPYTGNPRDYRDVNSDPEGLLCTPPGPLQAAAPSQVSDAVREAVASAYPKSYEHPDDPITDIANAVIAALPQPGRVEGMGDGLQGHAGTIVGWLRDGVFIGADADDNVSSYMDRGWQAVAVVPPSTVFALPELATPTAGGDA